MFEYQIKIRPLGAMYGSTGGFLSPENLVGRSGAKFPPDAATLAGLFFSAHYRNPTVKQELKEQLYVTGLFWAEQGTPNKIMVPIPWTIVIGEKSRDRWEIQWENGELIWHQQTPELDPDYTWQSITNWDDITAIFKNRESGKPPWTFAPCLHPQMKKTNAASCKKAAYFWKIPCKCIPNLS
ncbi:hypothetical protein [Phormidium sp. CCY1219]|uniref:hypothetical protein n=1 Tax=Phormidium sp. CCY1219 TaxID=2886104 RepID=UPI002D1EEC6F|nr:hypothetical protein [Phormidium sp. CCY1219]MEB3827777.1 hypothetical protein [Phormidium sp. CCY1219]